METKRTFTLVMIISAAYLALEAEASNPDVERTFMKYISNLFGEGDESCINIIPTDTEMKLIEHYPSSRQLFNFNISHADDDNLARFRHALKSSAFCAVAFLKSPGGSNMDDLKVFLSLTRPVHRHAVVYFSQSLPDPSLLDIINRPLIWALTTSESIQVYVLCPKYGKFAQPPSIPHSIATCNKNGCMGRYNSSAYLNLDRECPNPVLGQVVTIAEIPAPPYFLLPQIYGVKKVSGCLVNLHFYLAEYFKYYPNIIMDGGGIGGNATHMVGKWGAVQRGEADMAMGTLTEMFQVFDFGDPYWMTESKFFTRTPRQVVSYGNITRPFPLIVWLVTLFSISLFAIVIFISYILYNSEAMIKYGLMNHVSSQFDMFLFPFVKITEPDPLPWFTKWSTGKFVVLLWSLTSLLLVMFYTSNLRANMIMVNYEPEPRTLLDVANRGERVYMYNLAVVILKPYLEFIGLTNTDHYKVAVLAEETNGIYDPIEHGGIHRDSPKDMIDNGAFILTELTSLPYFYRTLPLVQRENIHVVDEPAQRYYNANLMRKYNPATEAMNRMTRRTCEMGLMNFWMTEHLPLRQLLKLHPPQVGLTSLEVSNFYTLFFFFAAGMTVAVAYFIVENTVRKPKKVLLSKPSHVFNVHPASPLEK